MWTQLRVEESRIDQRILHPINNRRHSHGKGEDKVISNKASDASKKRNQDLFRQTVEAVDAIVQLKLYKAKNSSLEQYFRTRWNISRAQVYRFMDCATVLRDLADFPVIPFRERVCRSLKTLAKNTEARQKLWTNVLERVRKEGIKRHMERLTSTLVENVWKQMIDRHDPVTLKNKMRNCRNWSDVNSAEEDSAPSETPYLLSPTLSLSSEQSDSMSANIRGRSACEESRLASFPTSESARPIVPALDERALARMIYNFQHFGEAMRQRDMYLSQYQQGAKPSCYPESDYALSHSQGYPSPPEHDYYDHDSQSDYQED